MLGGEEWMAMLAIQVGHAAPYLARMVQVVWQVSRAMGFSYKTQQRAGRHTCKRAGGQRLSSCQCRTNGMWMQPSPPRRRQGFLETRGESAV